MALNQAKYHLQKALLPDYLLPEEFLEPLEGITLDDILKIHKKLFEISEMKILFLGNSLNETSKSIANDFLTNISFNAAQNTSKPGKSQSQIVKFPKDNSFVYKIINQNNEDFNNAIVNYYQFGNLEPLDELLLKVITSSISKIAYGYLRTQHQLGYIVLAQSSKVNGVEGVVIGVQGSSKDPVDMNEIIESFLEYYRDYLNKKSEEVYVLMRSKVLQAIYSKRSKLDQRLDEVWKDIEMGDGTSDGIEKYLPVVGLISKKRVMSFYDKHFKNEKRKLSVQVYSAKTTTVLNDEVLPYFKSFGEKPEKILYSLSELKKFEKYSDNEISNS